MRAELLVDDRIEFSDGAVADLVVWRRLDGSFKYRLAYVVEGICVLRYDNEAGKGDHCHRGRHEMDYFFTTIDQLFEDFWRNVEELRNAHRGV